MNILSPRYCFPPLHMHIYPHTHTYIAYMNTTIYMYIYRYTCGMVEWLVIEQQSIGGGAGEVPQ